MKAKHTIVRGIISAARMVSSCIHDLFWVEMESKRGSAALAADERLFFVTRDVDALELDFIIDAGGSGTLQAADQDTGEIIWQSDITESAVLTQRIGPLKKERNYAIRFAGTASEYWKITVSSRCEDIRERIHAAQADRLTQAAQA